MFSNLCYDDLCKEMQTTILRLHVHISDMDRQNRQLGEQHSLAMKNNTDLVQYYMRKQGEWERVIMEWRQENQTLNKLNVFLRGCNQDLTTENEFLRRMNQTQELGIRKLELGLDRHTLQMMQVKSQFEIAMSIVRREGREAQDLELGRLRQLTGELEAALQVERAGSVLVAEQLKQEQSKRQRQVENLKDKVAGGEVVIGKLMSEIVSLQHELKAKTKQSEDFRRDLSSTSRLRNEEKDRYKELVIDTKALKERLDEETQRADRLDASNKANVASIEFISTRHKNEKGRLYETLSEKNRLIQSLCRALLPELSELPASQTIKLSDEQMHNALVNAQDIKGMHVAVKKLQEQVAELTKENNDVMKAKGIMDRKYTLIRIVIDQLKAEREVLREENKTFKENAQKRIDKARRTCLAPNVDDVLDDEDRPLLDLSLEEIKRESELWLPV